MPLVCEISIEAYCRPNYVIRHLIIHVSNKLSRNLTVYSQFRPIYLAIAAS
jgi:hypothetical protein